MAIRYPDGWGVYSWHGLRVPEWVITQPELITAEKIHAEKNQELRRALIERHTWDRYLSAVGARVVQTDDRGVLLELPDGVGDGDRARFVRVRCPSTGRQYALRVPPEIDTAAAGVAWTFGVDATAYRPSAET
jgi:hypothetical protein